LHETIIVDTDSESIDVILIKHLESELIRVTTMGGKSIAGIQRNRERNRIIPKVDLEMRVVLLENQGGDLMSLFEVARARKIPDSAYAKERISSG